MRTVTRLIHHVRSLAIRRLLIAVVAVSPVVEQAVPDACDSDGRTLQTQVVSTDLPGGGANDLPGHSVHLCHCSHAHSQMSAMTRSRTAVADERGGALSRHAFGLGRLADAPPARPPAVA